MDIYTLQIQNSKLLSEIWMYFNIQVTTWFW
jgi:hypothetical protein